MSEQIEPGDGWRLLGPDEPIKAGDEFWRDAIPLFKHEAGWIPTISGFIGLVAHGFKIRRRIPAKPEAMEIDGHTIANDNGFPRFSNAGNSTYYFSSIPESIRQLADWLTRYADWREAQDAAK